MSMKLILAAALALGLCDTGAALAQASQRGQAASPGQARIQKRLPQPPSGGVATGKPAAGPLTDQQRQADTQSRKATQICKGC